MAYLDALPEVKPTPFEHWKSNERVWKEWQDYVLANKKSANHKRNLLMNPPRFLQLAVNPIIELAPEHIGGMLSRIETKCKHFQIRDGVGICNRRLDLSRCPMMAVDDVGDCEAYRPLKPSGVKSYLDTTHNLYSWLLAQGQVERNPVSLVRENYLTRESVFFEEDKSELSGLQLTTADVVALVTKVPIQHGIRNLLMAKLGLRHSEVLSLTWSPPYYDAENRRGIIPRNYYYGSKRQGSRRWLADFELDHWLNHRYRPYWEDHVARDSQGRPLHDGIIIGQRGNRPADRWGSNYNTQLQRHAVRLGIMPNKPEPEPHEILTTHGFRRWACSMLARNGASPLEIQAYRGDKLAGSLGRYTKVDWHMVEGIYRNFAPRLGI